MMNIIKIIKNEIFVNNVKTDKIEFSKKIIKVMGYHSIKIELLRINRRVITFSDMTQGNMENNILKYGEHTYTFKTVDLKRKEFVVVDENDKTCSKIRMGREIEIESQDNCDEISIIFGILSRFLIVTNRHLMTKQQTVIYTLVTITIMIIFFYFMNEYPDNSIALSLLFILTFVFVRIFLRMFFSKKNVQ